MKTLITSLLAMASLIAFSQKKEYLVRNNGDTLFGSIQFNNKIFTVTGEGNQKNELSSRDVKLVNSNKFRGNTVLHLKLYTYTDNLVELERGWASTQELDTVMILTEVYTSAKMNLYQGTDVLKSQYYFYKQPTDSVPIQLVVRYAIGGGATALINGVIPIRDISRAHIQIFKGYVNQLMAIMGNCKRISNDYWENLDYREYSLRAVIKLYNKCK